MVMLLWKLLLPWLDAYVPGSDGTDSIDTGGVGMLDVVVSMRQRRAGMYSSGGYAGVQNCRMG